MLTYHAYAARSAKAPLEPLDFDPGPLGPEEVEIEVTARLSIRLYSTV